MLFISDISVDPYRNLAEEEYLLKYKTEPIFRLWRNDNAIIVGRYQNTLAEIDVDYVKEHNIKVVRRLTGGGAVFHDLGNINFTFIQERTPGEDTSAMFRRYTAPILGSS
jgi:lipoate-protein ligase A